MKKSKLVLLLGIVALFFTSCATVVSPVSGGYTNVKAPLIATSNSGASKVGTAEAKSILGVVARGDASIQAAAKSAGITKIHHVDYEAKSYFGFLAKYKVIVYGE